MHLTRKINCNEQILRHPFASHYYCARREARPGALLPSGDNSELYCKMNQDLTMLIQTYSLPFEPMTNS